MNSRFKLVVVTSSTFLVVLLLLGAVMGQSASPEEPYRHLSVYSEVLSRIKSEYVEEPDIKNVTLGAMNGLLESVDPFASYLSADQYKQFLKQQDTKKAGVGLMLSRKFGYVGVVNSIPGSAAAKAGLGTGDMLESIGGIATRDMPLAYAEQLLQGDPGTSVEITALRVRKPEPQKITLARAITVYPSVTSKLLPDTIGLIQIPALDASKLKEIRTHVDTMLKQGAKKLILDLRNTGIGKPEDGVAVANLFLDKGLITYVSGQKVKRQDFTAIAEKAEYKTQPIVIITNRGTANGAEIVASALLEAKRAEVVGERTYGDAAIRRAITMDDGAAVILSVAKYYSPSGKAIQDTGVTPSILMTDAEAFADTEEDSPELPEQPRKEKEEDLLLKKAIEVLTKAKTGSPAPEVAAKPAERVEPVKPITTVK
ncbi:MAG TPA: S41 family peptidase [Bryobacteraceae bacterium]|nr:S41 family peptidase [Bryobacteraceae bacterium]